MASLARIIAYKSLLRWSHSKSDPHSIIDDLIDNTIKPADAAFARELFFGSIKFKRKIEYYSKHYFASEDLEPRLRQILNLGFYQLIQTPNIPSYAVVSETVDLAKRFCSEKQAGFVNATLRNYQRRPTKVRLPDSTKDPVSYLGIEYSYPDWLIRRYLNRFGYEDTVKLANWGNTPPDFCFFINKYISTEDEVEDELTRLNIGFEKLNFFKGYYNSPHPYRLLRSEPFLGGRIIIGDPAQGLAVAMLDISLPEIVLDLFAAPGGKTASLAGIVGINGAVIAADISLKRLSILKGNVKRWRLDNVFILCSDALKFASRRKFRYILADVPCSGTGTIRRNPDLRWKLMESDIRRHGEKQAVIVRQAANMLKPAGRLIYSTCSLESEENRHVINGFLKQNQDFRLIDRCGFDDFKIQKGIYEVMPHRHLTDGAFVAIIERK